MFAAGTTGSGRKPGCYSRAGLACLEENTLFEYLCDRLDAEARDAVAEHAADCEGCRRMIAAAALQLTRTTTGEPGVADPAPRTVVEDRPERDVIAGKYRLVRLLGTGGMGTVHEAVNTWTGRRVALKQLRSTVSSDPSAAQRFMREARSASRIAHPNVVDILDLGQDPGTGALFMVQELLVGATLRQRLAERGALPIDEAVQLLLPALSALAFAHAARLVHRDLKPDNIYLARDANGREVTKLIDFGLSKQFSDHSDLSITEHGRQLGTPFYMSPEQLRGHDLDDRTDVWSIGVVLFEAVSGVRPFRGPNHSDLVVQILKEPLPRLAALMPGAPAAFAALIDRTLDRDRERRPRAGELHDALDEMIRRPELLALPPGNPYRGILPFEAEHRGVFFGRTSEVALLVARIRSESFVLVAGDSGVGKSSLVRAGVLPVIGGGGTRVVTTAPGRRPLATLAAAVAAILDAAPERLEAQLTAEPAVVAARLGSALGGPAADARPRLVVFVDQLEELITLADAEDAAATTTALAVLLDAAPGLRLIATVRSDFLARLSTLPGLGDTVTRALYLLKPLSNHAVREAIVGPARVTGLRFESPALVDELVGSAGASGGELPLLQFALAELWEARDVERGMLCASGLASLGGVAGALAHHADGVIGRLAPRQRSLARTVLTALITEEDTRARRTAAELGAVGPGEDPAAIAAVLEALVRGRLITIEHGAQTTYQIAHDVLVDGWDTLRGWRGHDVERSAARQRVARAAAEWDRLGRPNDALWRGRQLALADELDPRTLAPVDAAFVDQSRRTARRRRIARNAAALGIPLLLGVGFAGARLATYREVRAEIARNVAAADAAILVAHAEDSAVASVRAAAFAAFDAGRGEPGERGWTRVLDIEADVDGRLAFAAQQLETALALDRSDLEVRRRFAGLLFDRARFDERTYRTTDRDEQLQRLPTYDDDGRMRARWTAPALLSVDSTPRGAVVVAQRYLDDHGRRRLADPVELGTTPLAARPLAPDSYLLTLRLPDRPEVRAPIVLGRGEPVQVAMPVPREVPAGYVYVPPGRFLYGSSDNEEMRRTLMSAQPQHELSTPGYLIARTEVTFGDWTAFLDELSPADRKRHLPRTPEAVSAYAGAMVELSGSRAGRVAIALRPTSHTYTAAAGEPIRYLQRAIAAEQDWLRMPVSGVSWDDVVAYAAWLDRTRRLPGARPCDEREWERAARGADGRLFPHGDRLAPTDADFAETYGRVTEAFGPDEVGTHPASDSPFGVSDLAGNAWEWVTARNGDGDVAIRGGSWYANPLAARSNNREPTEPELREITIGLRICASLPDGGPP